MESPGFIGKAARLAAHRCSRNLASAALPGHRPAMRRLVFASALLLGACATRPQRPLEQPAQVPPQPRQLTRLTGMSAQDLVNHFGRPALQVQEGTSLKLQFRNHYCVLDAYLYPGPSGALRVTYVNTRTRSGADTNQASCISALEYPS